MLTDNKVAISVDPLVNPNNGIGRYTFEICLQLQKMDVDLYLYSASSIDQGILSCFPKAKIRVYRMPCKLLSILFFYFVLPFVVMADKCDLFWGPQHRLPIFLPKNIARIVTIHDLVWKHAKKTMPFFRWLLEKICMPHAIRSADKIITVSGNSAADIIKEFPNAKDKIHITYSGVSPIKETDGFDSLSSLGIRSPYFLFVGTLEPRKNLKRLLKAYSLVDHDLREQFQFVIVGGKGWGDVDVGSLISDIGLREQVVLLGEVGDDQLLNLYANTFFLAMPSLYEGFGLPIIEANSYGVPVLTSNCSSMPEVAGDAALFVDPLDEKSIASGIASFLGDRKYRDLLASKAKQNAARFSWEKAAKETVRVFQEALKSNKSK